MSSSLFPYASKVEETLRLASRRRLLVEAAEQLAPTLSVVLSGFALTLLLGTDSLGWLPVILLSAVGLTVAALRLKRRLLSLYRVAQMLDRKLSLNDTLSTAHFLLSSPAVDNNGAARFQLEQASRVAEEVKVQDAFPFEGKRAWALCGALLAVSFGLFALRYLVTQSLSLQPPLVALQMPSAVERLEKSLRPKPDHVKTPPLPRYYPANPITGNSTEARDNRSLPTEASDPAGSDDRNGELTKAQTQTAGKGKQRASDTKSGTRSGDGKSSGEQASEKTEERSEQQAGAQSPPSKDEQPANGQSNSPGLMNRMKDALSNMMAKMRANGAPQQSGQRNEGSQDQAKNNQSASAAAQQGQGNDRQNAQGEESSENQNAEGQAQGQTSERPQNGQGRSSDQSAQKGSDAQSGVGRQDGDKGIKDAEQLRAMGKLAEIIGKRSANLTGDMTVETPSGKQQLKTAYSQQVGRHSDSGGEINRNEIPMMYQQYVRDYMEHVRKQQAQSKP